MMKHAVKFPVALWLVCVGSVAWAEHASAQWVRQPSPESFAQTPGLEHAVFFSEAMQTNVGYCGALPPGYGENEKRYPVVYWLHGGGGDECTCLFVARAWPEWYKTKEVEPIMLVFPNGFRSGYMEHADGRTMNESMIIKELILVPDVGHEIRNLFAAEGKTAAVFQDGVFKQG